jgi:hypothetical protein
MKARTPAELEAMDKAMGTTPGLILAAMHVAARANTNRRDVPVSEAADELIDELVEMGAGL